MTNYLVVHVHNFFFFCDHCYLLLAATADLIEVDRGRVVCWEAEPTGCELIPMLLPRARDVPSDPRAAFHTREELTETVLTLP